jgi:hypothetical protein
MKMYPTLPLLAAALLGVAPLYSAFSHEVAEQGYRTTTGQSAHKEVTDSSDGIEDHTDNKRDEATRQAKAALDDIDARIDALEERIDKSWATMDNATRKHARSAMRALHEQRIQVAKWYGRLKNSTSKAWGHMNKGFAEAYKSLHHAWNQAEQDYQEHSKK